MVTEDRIIGKIAAQNPTDAVGLRCFLWMLTQSVFRCQILRLQAYHPIIAAERKYLINGAEVMTKVVDEIWRRRYCRTNRIDPLWSFHEPLACFKWMIRTI